MTRLRGTGVLGIARTSNFMIENEWASLDDKGREIYWGEIGRIGAITRILCENLETRIFIFLTVEPP